MNSKQGSRQSFEAHDLADRVESGLQGGDPFIWSVGRLVIDLFSSDHKFQMQIFFSWQPSQWAFAKDAFTMERSGVTASAFPPICLMHWVLRKVQVQSCLMIIITPCSPMRTWFYKAVELLTDVPQLVLVSGSLMIQSQTKISIPIHAYFAWQHGGFWAGKICNRSFIGGHILMSGYKTDLYCKIPTLCKLLWETGSRSRECLFIWWIS